jgi:hypothetical protein
MDILLDRIRPAEDVDQHSQQSFAAQMDGLAGLVCIKTGNDTRYSAHTDDYVESSGPQS